MAKRIAAAEWPALLAPGHRVWVSAGSNEPLALLEALAGQPEAARGVTFIQFPLPGLNRFDFTALHEEADMLTFFMTPDLRRSRARFLPMQMRFVFEYLRRGPLDVALIQVAQAPGEGLVVGPNVDFVGAALESARVVVAELNHGLSAPAGGMRLDEDRVDYVVESERPPATIQAPAVDDAARRIGAHVAELIRDGDCIQTGIGAIPMAILGALTDKHDLGLHGGLIDDGGMALIEAGNMTGARKNVDTHRHVVGMALGSEALHDWMAGRPDVVLAGADHTHELEVIRRIDNFVSINSAVEVDLHGQVNAEVAGGRQISGTGGAVDFMRGARASKGGRSIVAMNATARGGTVSRIVPRVEMVTALRTDVDLVVTEFGVADLATKTADERAEALIAIAHPDCREGLAG